MKTVQTKSKDSNLLIKARTGLYFLLGEVFLEVPSRALLISLSTSLRSSVTVKWLGFPNGLANSYKHFSEATREAVEDSVVLAQAAQDHTRLFLGPKRAVIYPYESVYLGKARRVLDEPALRLRSFYLEAGLIHPQLGQVPDDHIGLELHFLASLLHEAVVHGLSSRSHFEKTTQDFLKAHLLNWGLSFSREVSRQAESEFYRAAGSLLKSFLEFESSLIPNLDR